MERKERSEGEREVGGEMEGEGEKGGEREMDVEHFSAFLYLSEGGREVATERD